VAIVPWHRWPAWAEVNRRQLTQRRAASWALPVTTTADELADFWSGQPLTPDRGLIAIDSPDAESAEVLADVVRAVGFSAVWQPPRSSGFIDGVRAIVCEADDAGNETVERVAQLSRQFAPSPVVALLNFPQPEDIERIMGAGAAAVVAKPFTLHEILAQLEDALRRAGKSRSVAA
jgi:CheY-like chemotaxis protein